MASQYYVKKDNIIFRVRDYRDLENILERALIRYIPLMKAIKTAFPDCEVKARHSAMLSGWIDEDGTPSPYLKSIGNWLPGLYSKDMLL